MPPPPKPPPPHKLEITKNSLRNTAMAVDDDTFHTDVTLDLMTQLKDVLAISIAQGWDIFYEE